MNAILFGLKRAFQASIRFTRPLVGHFGLTAARFDMLRAIKPTHRDGYMRQSELRRILGVTAPTVSVMLRSLEKLGLVTRTRPVGGDARQRIVKLTIAGLACFRRAYRDLVRRRVIRAAFERVLIVGQSWVPGLRFLAMDNAEFVCRMVRDGFGDTAYLSYPWHPDD